MSDCNTCVGDLNAGQVDLAFRESEPYVEQEIRDRSYRFPSFLADYPKLLYVPDGVGYTFTKVLFHGDIGPQFDSTETWRREEASRPEATDFADATNACGYKFERVGHGFDEKHYFLMKKDLETCPICVEDIRTTWQFEQYQNLIYKNLFEVTRNQKEQLARNALIDMAVKYVVGTSGPVINTADPYKIPNLLGFVPSKITPQILKRFYSPLVREAGGFAIEYMNGRPMFGLMASDDVIQDMFLEDPDLRQDLRYGSKVDSLIEKYAFLESFRNMYIIIPDLFPARYKADVAGNVTRVFPYERDVAATLSGSRPAPNPEYETAPYELILIITKDVFNFRTRNALTTVGGATEFGPEPVMGNWKWWNPPCDRAKRTGQYWTTLRLGIEPGDFTDIVGLLVSRRPAGLDAAYWETCTPVDACANDIDPQGCPCPVVVGGSVLKTSAGVLELDFSRPITALVAANLTLQLKNGQSLVGVIQAKSADNLSVRLLFSGVDTSTYQPGDLVGVLCIADTYCDSTVSSICKSGALNVEVKLDRGLKCVTAADEITICFNDGTTVDVAVVSFDPATLALVLTETDGTVSLFDQACTGKGIAAVTCTDTVGCSGDCPSDSNTICA